MPDLTYHLGPWVLSREIEPHAYFAPAGSVAALDLSSDAECGSDNWQGGEQRDSRPLGFFAMYSDVKLSRDYYDCGTGHITEIRPKNGTRNHLSNLAGVAVEGDTLAEMMFSMLMAGDPRGESRWRPVMPCASGRHELLLGRSHGRVHNERFHWGSKHTNRVRDCVRQIINNHAGNPDHCRKVLGFETRKYFGHHDDSRFTELLPPGVELDPGRPETSHVDDFNTGDSATPGNQLTWIEQANYWSNESNTLKHTRNGGTNYRMRAQHDLSGSDSYAEVDATTLSSANNSQLGPAVRMGSATYDNYAHRLLRLSSPYWYLSKDVSGTVTTLDSDTTSQGVPAIDIRCTADGSSLTGTVGGSSRTSVTDSTISSGTRSGLWGFTTSVAYPVYGDNFECADISAGIAVPVVIHHMQMAGGL